MSKCDCCGCSITDDYGTSTVTGEGSLDDPYQVSRVDPAFVRPMVRITAPVQAGIANNTPTLVSFNTEVFDTDNMWVIGSPTVITIRTAGLWVFGASSVWPGNTTGNRFMFWQYTSPSGSITLIDSARDATTGDMGFELNYQWHFEVGDILSLQVAQTSGGALNHNSANAWFCWVGRFV